MGDVMIKRKSKKKTTRKKIQSYVVSGAFRMKSRKIPKAKADELAKKIRKSGGSATVRKV